MARLGSNLEAYKRAEMKVGIILLQFRKATLKKEDLISDSRPNKDMLERSDWQKQQ